MVSAPLEVLQGVQPEVAVRQDPSGLELLKLAGRWVRPDHLQRAEVLHGPLANLPDDTLRAIPPQVHVDLRGIVARPGRDPDAKVGAPEPRLTVRGGPHGQQPDLVVEVLSDGGQEVGLDLLRTAHCIRVSPNFCPLGHDDTLALLLELRPPRPPRHLQAQRPVVLHVLGVLGAPVPRRLEDHKVRGEIHAVRQGACGAQRDEAPGQEELLDDLTVGGSEPGVVEGHAFPHDLAQRGILQPLRLPQQVRSLELVLQEVVAGPVQDRGGALGGVLPGCAENDCLPPLAVLGEDAKDVRVQGPLEQEVVLAGLVPEDGGPQLHGPHLVAVGLDVLGRAAQPRPYVGDVGHGGGDCEVPDFRDGEATRRHLRNARHELEPGDDRLQGAPPVVVQEVDLVDEHEGDVREEAHEKALPLPRDGVELLRGCQDDVRRLNLPRDVEDVRPRQGHGLKAEPREALPPLRVLLVHQGVGRREVDDLQRPRTAPSAVRAQHADDRELHQHRLSRARRRANDHVSVGLAQLVEALGLDPVEVLEPRGEDRLVLLGEVGDGVQPVLRSGRGALHG
mmetsp:Transcript_6513/g.22395  ORF Transcript_6513/g.22395 Transcript_6513/m.22395 type:complete len:563 (+) Transcript_6513:5834-7522(+)